MHGTLDRLVVESELLADNPLGDPARRPLYVYRPPGVERDHPRPLPSVYVIQGYTGQVDMWFNRQMLEPTMIERIDAMFAAGECPDAIVVFVDCWTSYGGSQFLNSHEPRPLPGLPVRRGPRLRRRPLPDARRPRPPRPDRQVVGRLRRDGRADDAAGRVRRARLARRRRAVRGLLPARVPAGRSRSCATTSTAPTTSSSSAWPAPTSFDFETWFPALDIYGYAAAYSPDPEQPGQGAAAVRRRHRPPDRRRLGAVARPRPGAHGASAR